MHLFLCNKDLSVLILSVNIINFQYYFRRKRLFPQPAHHITSHSTSRKCSTSSHREPCVMTSLKDHDSDCDLDNHEIYIKHRQQQCVQTCFLPTHDGWVPDIHAWDCRTPLKEDNMNTAETTDVSKLAGIHKSHSISSSQLYGRAGLSSDNSKCSVSDCNRPRVDNIPMLESSVPGRTLLRTNSGKVRRPIPCETTRYLVLEHQS